MSSQPTGASARAPARVFVERLKLANFRNYSAAAIDLLPGLVVLSGENGAGKTNLLEAVSLLTPGRGLRRAAYAEMAGRDASAGFAIHAALGGDEGECDIGTGASGGNGDGEGGRKVRINGAAASMDDLMERLRVIWLTPAMDALFTGAAGDRRRYLDRLVLAIDPAHARRAQDYERAMRGRNRLLAEQSSDGRWFDAIEAQMAETGVAIAAARTELVQLLRAMTELLPEDGAFPKADIELDGELERDVALRPAAAGGRRRSRFRRPPGGGARPRPCGGTHIDRAAPLGSAGAASAQGHAGAVLFDGRAEGAAGRHDAVACAADR